MDGGPLDSVMWRAARLTVWPGMPLASCTILLSAAPPRSVGGLGRQIRDQPSQERFRTARLEVDVAGAGEIDHQALAAEDGRFPAPNLAHPVRYVRIERDDVAGVEGVPSAGDECDLVDCAEAERDQRAAAGAAEHEQPLAAEERARATPFAVDRDRGATRQVTA